MGRRPSESRPGLLRLDNSSHYLGIHVKILFVNLFDDPKDGAGAERSINTLMLALKNYGHDVAIAGTSNIAGLHRHDRDGIRVWRAGIKNVYWPRIEVREPVLYRRVWHVLDSYNWLMRKQLETIIDIEQPDVISLHNVRGWSAAALDAVKKKGIPAVQTLHDYYYLCPNTLLLKANINCTAQCTECRVLRLPHRRLAGNVNTVIGLSQFSLSRHLDAGYFTEVPVKTVVQNTRSPEALRLKDAQALRERADVDRVPGQVRFGFIGTLNQSKGIEVLLRNFKELETENAELLIAGTGDLNYVLELKKKFASSKIRFLGKVMQHEFYPQIDVTVVPSIWHDTFPMVVPESLAYGVPVIASARGGIPELIKDDVNGLLFEPAIPGDLSRVMKKVLATPGNLHVLKKKSEESAAPFLDIPTWVEKYNRIYLAASKFKKQ
jgi:glycosyltransferase involved in cell wall biosynthesis